MSLRTLLIILVLPGSFLAFGQHAATYEGDECYALRVSDKRHLKDTASFTENYHPYGFYVLRNGVYDFRTMGHKYFFHRVLRITPKAIYICPVFDSTKSIALDLERDIAIRLQAFYPDEDSTIRSLAFGDKWQWRGFPALLRKTEYQFDVVRAVRACQIPPSKVCLDEHCKKSVSGYKYFSADNNCWAPIYQEHGSTYMIADSTMFYIDRVHGWLTPVYKPKEERLFEPVDVREDG